MLEEYGEILEVKDYMKIMKRCKRLAYQDVRQPGFPSIRVGNSIKIVKSGFLRWLEEKQTQNKAV